MARTTQATRAAGLRKRANTRLAQLRGDYYAATAAASTAATLREREREERRAGSYLDEIADIQKLTQRSYVRGRDKAARAGVPRALDELERHLGAPQRGGTRAQAQEQRRERAFASAIARVRHGETSSYFSDEENAAPLESIFYAATQDYWQGGPAADRDKLIMEGLGVDTLEEAYEIVLAKNARAVEAASDGGVVDGKSYMYIAYIVYV